MWLRYRRNQCDCRTIRMCDQCKGISCKGEDWLQQCHFVAQRNRAIGWPCWTPACAKRVRGQHVERRCKRLHQRAPLARATRVCVQADDSWARAGLAEVRSWRLHASFSGHGPPASERREKREKGGWLHCHGQVSLFWLIYDYVVVFFRCRLSIRPPICRWPPACRHAGSQPTRDVLTKRNSDAFHDGAGTADPAEHSTARFTSQDGSPNHLAIL